MAIDSAKARKKLEESGDLPTLPSVASQIIALAQSPTTNAADVGNMIERDQALTTKVLKLVNSSFYGFPGQIRSIQHAVVILGFNKVKNVVVTASVFDLAKGKKGIRLDLPKFWEHSLGTAIASKVVTKAIGGSLQPDDAFVGGLIHDIGKLILDQFLPQDYDQVIQKVREDKCLLQGAEKELLGFDHTTVGCWMAEKWKLPSGLLNAIKNHHRPEHAREEREMVAAVHLGDILARSIGIGNGGDMRMPKIKQAIWQQYNLSNYFLDQSLQEIICELNKAQDFFDMIHR
jgi:putative nucleotidyltransferase with HDIG domain